MTLWMTHQHRHLIQPQAAKIEYEFFHFELGYNNIFNNFQDEHGQSMLHFSAARSHGRNALFQLIEESDVNISYRDELYRTCRDVALQGKIFYLIRNLAMIIYSSC